MQNRHIVRLILKGVVFLIALVLAIASPNILIHFFNYPLWFFKVYHLLWAVISIWMAKTLLVPSGDNIGSGKIYKRFYKENDNKALLDEQKLAEYTKASNNAAIKSLLFWLAFIVLFGVLYLIGFASRLWVFIFVIFLYFMDEFFIDLWCPFRSWIIKNKCCNACRIYNWGSFMRLALLLLIPSFWTYSLVFLSFLIVVKWEYLHHMHPERFYELFNTNLMCRHCKSKAGKCIMEKRTGF